MDNSHNSPNYSEAPAPRGQRLTAVSSEILLKNLRPLTYGGADLVHKVVAALYPDEVAQMHNPNSNAVMKPVAEAAIQYTPKESVEAQNNVPVAIAAPVVADKFAGEVTSNASSNNSNFLDDTNPEEAAAARRLIDELHGTITPDSTSIDEELSGLEASNA